MMYSLTYLRGLAALFVSAFVAGELWARGMGVQNPLVMGYAGIDIFLVVSGFAIWLAIAKGGSPVIFLARRFAGVAPLYWLATLAVAAVLYLAPSVLAPETFNWNTLIASVLFLPTGQAGSGEVAAPVIAAGWAVNYLAAFCLLAAIVLLLPRVWRLIALVGALGGLALIGVAPQADPVVAFYSNAIGLEFAFGALIAALWLNGFRLPDLVALPGLIAGLVALWVLAGAGLPRIVAFGLPAALLLASAVSLEEDLQRKPDYLGQFLGEASYAIFLTHGLAIAAFTLAWNMVVPGAPMWVYLPATLTVSVLVGGAVHMSLEKPLRDWLARESEPTPELSFDQERRMRNATSLRMVDGKR